MATPLRDPASWSDASVSKRAATTCNKELRFAVGRTGWKSEREQAHADDPPRAALGLRSRA